MGYTALQGQPIFVNLLQAAADTGWTVNGSIATHSTCNSGSISLLNYNVIPGQKYTVTFQVLSISSGYLQLVIGSVGGAQVTTSGFYTQQITASTTGVSFFSNANCQVELFNIQVVPPKVSTYQQNTIAFSEITDKWGSWYTFVPDIGRSLFENTYLFNQGIMYAALNGSDSRCNFFGQQFPSTIKFTTNQQPTISKTYLSVNYQANELLVTSPSGINTANGQVSELIPTDFVQQTYSNGAQTFQVEGIYKASFMRDMQVDIVNGDILQGRWATVELTTQSPSNELQLFTTEICYTHSYANTR